MEQESINHKRRGRNNPHGIHGSINDIRKDLLVLIEIKRDSRKVKNIKRARLLKKYNIEKEEKFINWLKSLNKIFQQRHGDYLGTRKDKTSIIKIKCLGQIVRNFITVLGRHTPK
jgi:hypothetical protein